MRNINESQEFYVVVDQEGTWYESNNGPYKTLKNALKEAGRSYRFHAGYRVVKMVPIFFDVETGERITPLPEGMM